MSRSHALRGNAVGDALRHGTQSVPVCIPTRSVGTRINFINNNLTVLDKTQQSQLRQFYWMNQPALYELPVDRKNQDKYSTV